MNGIDISNWQRGFDLKKYRPDFVIVKATEGISYVDKSCDNFIQQAISNNIPWGFYHFARPNNASTEAEFFYNNTKGYTRKGIPVLDFEDSRCSNDWLNTFVSRYHDLSGVFPWIYMNSDFINNKKYGTPYVKNNCGLWLAGYPSSKRTTTYPATPCPYEHNGWTLAAWQFTDKYLTGNIEVDADIFYGNVNAWNLYANPESKQPINTSPSTLDLATRVINGEYGNGTKRREALGARYAEVQSEVSKIYQMANDAIRGKYGNGQSRKNALGSYYPIVQQVINTLSN